ncbi:MAG: hypothetical protein HRT52_03000 [Colwellia sp.]|nr:hypothetical protein [Colwellia sp.]
MENESAASEFTNKVKEAFPSIKQEEKEPVVNLFVELINSLEKEINENKYRKYLSDIPENVDKAEHLSKIPDGVLAFESWLYGGLADFAAKNISKLEEIMPSQIGHLYFSLFLDDQNFEKYFEKTKFTPEIQAEFRVFYSELFSQTELKRLIQSIGCACIGLHNSATSLMTSFIQQLMFDDDDMFRILNEAKKLEIIRIKAQKDSKRSNDKKHAKTRKVKEYALKLYLEGSFPSVKNCSENIDEDVMAYAKSDEIKKLPGKDIVLNPKSVARKIERWIGIYNKEQRSKSHS